MGWDAHLDELFTSRAAAGAAPARVTRVDRGSCLLATAEGEQRRPLAGRLLQQPPEGGVTAGDWVVVDSGRVVDVLPRRTVLLRKLANDVSASQAVAANLDVGVAVTPLGAGVNLRRVERTLAQVWSSGAQPVVLLTKADLSDDLDADIDAARDVATGAAVLAFSAVSGQGIEAVRSLVAPGRTAVLLGPSGAGKSTLANLLAGHDLLATAAVRSDGRGRHTTTHRELLLLPGGGMLIDTPGLRELALWDAAEGIEDTFTDIAELAQQCRFRDCSHGREPGCAVRQAAKHDARIAERLRSQGKLGREQRRTESRVAGYVRAQRHRDVRVFSRSLRSRPGKRDWP